MEKNLSYENSFLVQSFNNELYDLKCKLLSKYKFDEDLDIYINLKFKDSKDLSDNRCIAIIPNVNNDGFRRCSCNAKHGNFCGHHYNKPIDTIFSSKLTNKYYLKKLLLSLVVNQKNNGYCTDFSETLINGIPFIIENSSGNIYYYHNEDLIYIGHNSENKEDLYDISLLDN